MTGAQGAEVPDDGRVGVAVGHLGLPWAVRPHRLGTRGCKCDVQDVRPDPTGR